MEIDAAHRRRRARLDRHALCASGERARARAAIAWGCCAACGASAWATNPKTAPPYSQDWAEASGREETVCAPSRATSSRSNRRDIAPGDVALFRMLARGPAKHCGIIGCATASLHERGALDASSIRAPTRAWRRNLSPPPGGASWPSRSGSNSPCARMHLTPWRRTSNAFISAVERQQKCKVERPCPGTRAPPPRCRRGRAQTECAAPPAHSASPPIAWRPRNRARPTTSRPAK